MPQGLQIFDENGKEIFSPKTRTVKILKKAPLVGGADVISVTHPLVSKLTPFYIITPHTRAALSHYVRFDVTGQTAKLWLSDNTEPTPNMFTVYLGVY